MIKINPLAAKLCSFAPLPDEDVEVLDRIYASAVRRPAGTTLINEGDRPNVVFLLVEGWAYRYKTLPDGGRQIVAVLLPGDLCDVQIFILKQMDHSIALLTEARVARIPRNEMVEVFEQRPVLARALWWSTLTDEAVLREWLVNIGQREAFARLAHLLLELHLRLKMVGLARGNSYDLPLTQIDLGDATGLTPIHTNRMIRRLRAEGLIALSRGRLDILDLPGLMQAAQFEPNYLHLENRPAHGGVPPEEAA